MGPTGRFVVGTTVVQPLIGGHAFRNGLHMLKRAVACFGKLQRTGIDHLCRTRQPAFRKMVLFRDLP